MATQWLRRAWLLAASASVLVLAACGGGTIESQLDPGRVIAFGDGMADVGQNGARYTVNDDSINVWTHFVANAFNRPLAPSASGGLSFATGNARVTLQPDAAGGDAPTVRQQINAFLASNRFDGDDLVLVNAGTSDVIAEAQAVLSGAQTPQQMLLDLEQAGIQLADQVKRLVDAGAEHVIVLGPYNLGRSPWALQTGQEALLQEASAVFNRELKLRLFRLNLAEQVLYLDAEEYFNNFTGVPERYDLANATEPVCTGAAVDPGQGIGTGENQVNSNLCDTSTLVEGAEYAGYLFADRVYPTPRGHQLLGDLAFNRIRERW